MWAALAVVPTPVGLAAQTVVGLVSRVTTPLPGVLVQLLDSTAISVARTLTDPRGAYRLLAPRPGTYQLATRSIGFAPFLSERFVLSAGEVRDLALAVTSAAVSLDTVRVSGSSRVCGTDKATTPDFAGLLAVWEQARTALTVADASLDGGESRGAPMRTTLLRYLRTTPLPTEGSPRTPGGQSTLLWLARVDVDSATIPWRSPPVRDLMRNGYIVQSRESTEYLAPSLAALASPEFAKAYCFQVVAPTDSARVVLAFEPARPHRDIAELHGTMTLDRQSAELRSLDFGYTNTPSYFDSLHLGGTMDFVRLRDNRWAIGRWNIRTPTMSAPQVDRTSLRGRVTLRLTGFATTGGDLMLAQRGADTLFARVYAAVSGVARDARRDMPLPYARLRVRNADRETRADSLGRFTLTQLLPGDYTLLVNSASLDSVGATASQPLFVADSVSTYRVSVLDAQQVVPTLCNVSADDVEHRGGIGVLRGLAGFADGSSAPKPVTITVTWKAAKNEHTMTLSTDAEGRYRACGVPFHTDLLVRATSGTATVEARIRVDSLAPFVRLDLTLDKPTPETSAAAFGGKLHLHAHRQYIAGVSKPIAQARVRLCAACTTATRGHSGRTRPT